jgi:hypothetical protein
MIFISDAGRYFKKKKPSEEAAIFKSLKCHVTIIAIFKWVFYEGSNSSLLFVGAH